MRFVVGTEVSHIAFQSVSQQKAEDRGFERRFSKASGRARLMTNRKLIDKEKFAIDIIANTLQMAQIFYNAFPSLIFEPKNNLKHLAKHLNQILQYLIRTYASRSNDCSTETSIASAAICYE